MDIPNIPNTPRVIFFACIYFFFSIIYLIFCIIIFLIEIFNNLSGFKWYHIFFLLSGAAACHYVCYILYNILKKRLKFGDYQEVDDKYTVKNWNRELAIFHLSNEQSGKRELAHNFSAPVACRSTYQKVILGFHMRIR